MLVQILGPGCPKCTALEKTVRALVAEKGLDALVEKVTDFQMMAAMGVFATPALAVDGLVKCSGRSPSRDELLDWLR